MKIYKVKIYKFNVVTHVCNGDAFTVDNKEYDVKMKLLILTKNMYIA